MLPVLALLACGTPNDTGSDRLDVVTEKDSLSGTYNLALALDPDPPVLGPQTLEVALTRNSDNTDFDGALVAGATLSGTLRAPENGSVDPISISFDEEPSGTYTASWTWSASGYWELTAVIGDMEEDDGATLAFLVDDAR